MGTTSQKLEYLGETKTQLKDTINLTGANLTTDTFRSYPSKLYKKLLDAVVDSDTLFNNLPKVNGTGTDITLNNTDECKIKFNMLGGNTEQDTYLGSQLFDKDTVMAGYRIGSDGSPWPTDNCNLSDYISVSPNTTYYRNIELGGNNTVAYYDTNKDFIERLSSTGNTFTTTSTTYYIRTVIDDDNLDTLMLNEGSTGLPFEPYTGGTASPNPNYPQEIRNAGFESYNLVDFNNYNTLATGTRYSFKNGVLYVSNNVGTYRSVSYNITDLYKANAGKTLRFCYDDIDISNQYGTVAQLSVTYSDGTATSYQALLNHGLVKTNREIPADTSNVSNAYLNIQSNNTSTAQAASVAITHPMLIFGTEDKPYMPYGYFANVEVHSKNFFNPTIPLTDFYGVNATINNQQITFDGTSTSGKTGKMVDTPIPAGTYKLSFKEISGTHTSGKKVYFDFYNAAGTKIANPDFTTDGSKTITLPSEANRIALGFQSGDTFDNYTFVAQIEEGEIATEYQQYYPPQIKRIDLNIYDNVGNVIGHRDFAKIGDYRNYFRKSTGKNLFDKDNANNITLMKSASGDYFVSVSGIKSAYIEIKPNTTYTVKKIASQRFSLYLSTQIPNTNVAISSFINGGSATTQLSITSNSTDKYLTVYYWHSSDTLTEQQILDSIQIEENNQATEYEPYGKVWYYKKEIEKVVLDGNNTGTWAVSGTKSGLYNIDTNALSTISADTSKCSHFSVFDKYVNTENSYGIGNDYYRLYNPNSLSESDLKAWLAQNPVSIQYVLNTPEYEIITNENVINSLESIVKSYEDETHIISVDDVPMYLDVSAVRKYEE